MSRRNLASTSHRRRDTPPRLAPHRRRGSNHLATTFYADAVARLSKGGTCGAGAALPRTSVGVSPGDVEPDGASSSPVGTRPNG
jgi:hypothetical protein